jgi:hypothetical protein
MMFSQRHAAMLCILTSSQEPIVIPKLQNGYNTLTMIICAKKSRRFWRIEKKVFANAQKTDQDASPAEELTLQINKKSQPFWCIVSRQ